MNSSALDSYITGNYGEDSIGDDMGTTVHYHVVAGTVGCLPDGEPSVYETRKDAERAAIAEARDYREAGYTVTGNVKMGYAIDPINYLMVEACTESACLIDN